MIRIATSLIALLLTAPVGSETVEVTNHGDHRDIANSMCCHHLGIADDLVPL